MGRGRGGRKARGLLRRDTVRQRREDVASRQAWVGEQGIRRKGGWDEETT